MRLSKSYIEDLLAYGNCYVVNQHYAPRIRNEKLREQFLKTKTIAAEIVSRHSRGKIKDQKTGEDKFKTKYKVLLQYQPTSIAINPLKVNDKLSIF
jgi:hypothetical protein